MATYCANCGMELPDGVAFCDACGTPVRGQNAAAPAVPASGINMASASPNGIGTTSCPVCGATTLPGEAFCDNCGAALLSPTTYTPAPPAHVPAQQPMGAPPSYSQTPMSAPAPAPAPGYNYAPGRVLSASLVVTQPPPPATLQIPNRNELIVGRSDPQSNSYPDVDLGPYGGLDLGISRRHFRITRNGDHFYLEDLNALNGSVVNGQRIPPYTLHPLRSGDRISLGKMEMIFEIS